MNPGPGFIFLTERKELVSSHVVSRDHEGWIKLDMKSAVESWLDKPKKNFGILVVTEDSEDRILKPEHVFVTPNCSDENGWWKYPCTINNCSYLITSSKEVMFHLHLFACLFALTIIPKVMGRSFRNFAVSRIWSKEKVIEFL